MPFYKKDRPAISRSRWLESLAEKDGLRHLIVNTVYDRYTGEWKKNEKYGKGVLLTRNKDLYEGDFERNYRHGFGVLAYELSKCKVFSLGYRGEWKNGYMEGQGLRIYRDGSFYLGNWKRGKRHGYGQMWYGDGSFYDGDWVNDVRQGLGLWAKANGNRYEGAWYNDKRHGKGRFFFLETGQMQEGAWFNDLCTFSIMCDIPFRQSCINPTVYPIPETSLINLEDICKTQEARALIGQPEDCLHLDEGPTHSQMTLNIDN